MNTIDIINDGLNSIASVHEVENGVRLNTHCLYPSNGFVQVVVMGVQSSFEVSDDGGALREAINAGAEIDNPERMFAKMLKAQGLSIKNGVIRSPRVAADALPTAIALVANASKEIADRLFEKYKITRIRNFKEILNHFLKHEFVGVNVNEMKMVGSSNKMHNFENVVDLSGGRYLIVDPVVNDANSINSRVVANIDLKNVKRPGLEQRIVYDDEGAWSAAELNLLQVAGVPVIPFSKSLAPLKRLMAA